MLIDLHTKARRVGNSWAILIPKDKADELGLTSELDLHVNILKISKLRELRGTFRSKKSTEQLMREVDKGWD